MQPWPTRPRWLRFGRWPSENDLDLMLEGGDAAALAAIVSRRVRDPCFLVAPLAGLPVPPGLWAAAIRAAGGLPVDAFLVPRPGGWSLVARTEPPYEWVVAQWVPTGGTFFARAVPLRVPPPPLPTLGSVLARAAGLAG